MKSNMLLNKVKEKGIDLYILIKDDMHNLYEPHPFMTHANYDSFHFHHYLKNLNQLYFFLF